MIIGAMNNPRHELFGEIRVFAQLGLDFIDLTFEPPRAAVWQIEPAEVRRALTDHGLQVVGHTAHYLPLASPFESIRRAAVEELRRCLDAFARVGAAWMNVHPDRNAPLHDRRFFIDRNLQSLGELGEAARAVGVGLMIENLPGEFNNVEQLADLLEPIPELGLHLDIGHANLTHGTNTAEAILKTYGSRLRHVHLHDNKGGHADLHLPLGAGTVNLPRQVRALKAAGYDGTITLEVFTSDRHYLTYSHDRLRQVWDAE